MKNTSQSNSRAERVQSNGQHKEQTGQKSFMQLFEDELKSIYGAEQMILESLPELIDAVSDPELEETLNDHKRQSEKQVERLEKIFERLQIDKEEGPCRAVEELVEENKAMVKEYQEGPVRDAAIIIGIQKIEHYEIAAYGSLRELADVLGFDRVSEILDRTLREEEETDFMLSEIAHDVNDEACEVSEEEEMEY